MYLFFSFLIFISDVQAFTRTLKSGTLRYEASDNNKTFHGTSTKIRGTISCERECEILLAAPINSLDSGDPRRDGYVLQVLLDSYQFPVVTAKAKFYKELWQQKEFTLVANIRIRGFEQTYLLKVTENGKYAQFDLDLEKHNIKIPLFSSLNKNRIIPIYFTFEWSE